MKHIPLEAIHIELGAKMVEFAGFYMPVSYAGIKEEHLCVRNNVGIFDVSHMGEFIVKGKDALAFVQYITSNDVSKLNIGDAQYSCLPNHQGGIVDDLLVYRLSEDKCTENEKAFMLVVNGANIEKDWKWIFEIAKNYEITLNDISDQTALFAVQGPNALPVMAKLTALDLLNMKYYTFDKGTVAGVENVLISATGYTGAGGFEVYVNAKDALKLWQAILESGKDFGIQPIGLGARDTLRLEMGFCLYGNDIDDTTSPIEAGLSWITKLNKGDFIACSIFNNQKINGIKRKLVAFEMIDKGIPRKEYRILDEKQTEIGKVCSGTQSPSLDKAIGMGYVTIENSKLGNSIYIEVRNKLLVAKIVKLPFYNSPK